jgi:hypothetical protein
MKEKKLFEASQPRELSTTRIKYRAPFRDLFPVDKKKVEAIAEHMKVNGYDKSQPVTLWDASSGRRGRHELVMIDGHTRLQAAGLSRIGTVYAVVVKFKDEAEALAYAVHNQRDRRNLTDGALLKCIAAMDKRKQQGARTDLASPDAKSGKSSEETAAIVGTSSRKVEKARTVLAKADEQAKQEVLTGIKTINAAYNQIKEASLVVGAEPEVVTNAVESEPQKAIDDQPHFLCPYCGHRIYESEIRLSRKS